jgi:hypothetical protein
MHNNIIEACNKYMLTNENMSKTVKINPSKKNQDRSLSKERVNISAPHNLDNLFWCFYIIFSKY